MAPATGRVAGRRAWEGDSRGGSGAGGRGLELLTILFDARRPLDVGTIALAMGTTRGAAHLQLRELEDLAFVTRDGDRRWCLPPGGVVTLSATLVARLNLRAAARPVIERIAARTGETVSVSVRSREHRLRIDAIAGRPPRPRLPVGETVPLHAGTSGKVILAFLPRAETASVMAGAALEAQAERQVRAQLARARRDGCLTGLGDRLPSVGSLSVPIFGSSGIAGAVTVVGPAGRWGPEAISRAAAAVRIECAALSAALGSLPPLD
jgi:DNA-binding IclR family transcriptional regulator